MNPQFSPFVDERLERYRAATRFARTVEEYAAIALGEWTPEETLLRLFKVAPHAYGPGKTHLVDETRGSTFCGKPIEGLIGEALDGRADDIDCRGCLATIERQKARDALRNDDAWTIYDEWFERCGGVP